MQEKKKKRKRKEASQTDELISRRDYFEPRIPCSRTFPGGWQKTNAVPLRGLLDEPANPSVLAGSTFRRTIVNYSDKDVFVFNRTGELIDVIPPTYSTTPNIVMSEPKVHHTQERNRRPPEDDPFAKEVLYTNHRGESQNRPFTGVSEQLLSAMDEETRSGYVKTAIDPNMELLAGRQYPGVVENALVIELTRLTPLSLSDDKGRRKGTVREVTSRIDRSQDIERWVSKIDVNDFEQNAGRYDGCDAVYHPGSDLYFSTNSESKYVGKIDEALFATLTSSNFRLNTDGICPVVVFANSDTIEDVVYYSLNGHDIFSAPIIRSALMPAGIFRIRTTSFVEDANGDVQHRTRSMEFSWDQLKENQFHVVLQDSDIILGRSVGELKSFLTNHPLHGLFGTNRSETQDEDTYLLAQQLKDVKTQLEQARHEIRKSHKEVELLRTNIGTVLAQFKKGEFKTPEDLIKALTRAQTQITMPVEDTNLFAHMAKVEKATKGIAGVSKNIKEIILFSTAIVGAAGTLGATAMAIRDKWRRNSSGSTYTVIKGGDV